MAAIRTLTTRPAERGHIFIDLSFKDEDGTAVVPNAIAWTLTDSSGVVINNRSAVAVSPLASVTIIVSGDDLAIGADGDQVRLLLVEWNYDSTVGNGVPDKTEIRFTIEDLKAVL